MKFTKKIRMWFTTLAARHDFDQTVLPMPTTQSFDIAKTGAAPVVKPTVDVTKAVPTKKA